MKINSWPIFLNMFFLKNLQDLSGTIIDYGVDEEKMKEFKAIAVSSFSAYVRTVLSYIVGDDVLLYCTASGVCDGETRPGIPEELRKAILS